MSLNSAQLEVITRVLDWKGLQGIEYDKGYEDGKSDGYEKGLEEGHVSGYKDAEDDMQRNYEAVFEEVQALMRKELDR